MSQREHSPGSAEVSAPCSCRWEVPLPLRLAGRCCCWSSSSSWGACRFSELEAGPAGGSLPQPPITIAESSSRSTLPASSAILRRLCFCLSKRGSATTWLRRFLSRPRMSIAEYMVCTLSTSSAGSRPCTELSVVSMVRWTACRNSSVYTWTGLPPWMRSKRSKQSCSWVRVCAKRSIMRRLESVHVAP